MTRTKAKSALALGLAALLAFVQPAFAATVVVKTTGDLINAMTKGVPGDVIQMAPGRYDGVTNYNRPVNVAAPGITVTSQDPAHPAAFINFFLGSLHGVRFYKVDMDTTPPLSLRPTFQLSQSDGVTFDTIHIHGDMSAPDVAKYVANAAGGLMVRDSKNIKIINSIEERVPNGIAHLNIEGLTIQGNTLRDIRSNGIYGGGSNSVLIDKNTMYDFWPESSADHPDYIQFWTANTTTAQHDIAVTNNILKRGKGGHAQGVFMGNDTKMPWVNVKITGNRIEGSSWRGISVGYATNVEIARNVVGEGPAWVDPLAPTAQVVTSAWITADFVNGYNVHDNWSDAYMMGSYPGSAVNGVIWANNRLNAPGQIGQ